MKLWHYCIIGCFLQFILMQFFGKIAGVITYVFFALLWGWARYYINNTAESTKEGEKIIEHLYELPEPTLEPEQVDQLLSEFDKQAKENIFIRSLSTPEIEQLKRNIASMEHTSTYMDHDAKNSYYIKIAAIRMQIFRLQKQIYNQRKQKV